MYQVGDVVMVVKDWEQAKGGVTRPNAQGEMDCFLGTFLTIEEAIHRDDGTRYFCKGNTWVWCDKMFVPVFVNDRINPDVLMTGDSIRLIDGDGMERHYQVLKDTPRGTLLRNNPGDKSSVVMSIKMMPRLLPGTKVIIKRREHNADFVDMHDDDGNIILSTVYKSVKAKKMTMAEVCKELGYDIELVKEEI